MALNPPQGSRNQGRRGFSSERSGKLPKAGGAGLGGNLAVQGASLHVARESWPRANRYPAVLAEPGLALSQGRGGVCAGPTAHCWLRLTFPDRPLWRERFHPSRGSGHPALLRACTRLPRTCRLGTRGPGCPPRPHSRVWEVGKGWRLSSIRNQLWHCCLSRCAKVGEAEACQMGRNRAPVQASPGHGPQAGLG